MDNDNNKFVSSSTRSEAIKAVMTGSGEKMDAGFFNTTLPVGYRFAPTDEELIDYLNMKLSGERLSTDQIIEVDLYAYDPQDLTGEYKLCREKEWYFFTPREKKYPNGVRPSRGTSDGYWKLTGTETPIQRNGRTIGLRTGLDFYKGKRTGGKRTDWKMHEYRLAKPSDRSNKVVAANSGMQLDKWVLCKIYKNTRSVKTGDDHQAQELGVIPSEDANEDGPLENNQHGSEGGQIQQITDQIEATSNPALQSNNGFEDDYHNYAEIMALCSTETPPNFDTGLSPMDQTCLNNQPALFNEAALNYDMGLSPILDQTTCLNNQPALFNEAALNYEHGVESNGSDMFDEQPALFNEAVLNYDTGLSPILDLSINQPSSSSLMFPDNNLATICDFLDQSYTVMEYQAGHSNVHYPKV